MLSANTYEGWNVSLATNHSILVMTRADHNPDQVIFKWNVTIARERDKCTKFLVTGKSCRQDFVNFLGADKRLASIRFWLWSDPKNEEFLPRDQCTSAEVCAPRVLINLSKIARYATATNWARKNKSDLHAAVGSNNVPSGQQKTENLVRRSFLRKIGRLTHFYIITLLIDINVKNLSV